MTEWQPGMTITDRQVVRLPNDITEGSYVLRLGLYDLTSGQRLPTTSGPDRVSVMTIDVKDK